LRWHERCHLAARTLPPSSPLLSSTGLIFLPGKGAPIHSVRVDLLFHTGSTRDASDALIASADVMALVPLMGIGLVLPTNIHVMDGLPLR